MTVLMALPSLEDKLALRRVVRRARASLSSSYRQQAEAKIVRSAVRFIRRGKRIGGYLATGSELDIERLLSRVLQRGAEVYLPIIPDRGRRLWFSRVGPENRWYRHPRYAITEYAGPVLRLERLDVLFVPLLAVDDEGFRLGQGGGFYDTSLHAARCRRPLLVGLAFDCQRVCRVPRDAWDIQLDWLVTESGVFHFPALTY